MYVDTLEYGDQDEARVKQHDGISHKVVLVSEVELGVKYSVNALQYHTSMTVSHRNLFQVVKLNEVIQ